MRKLNALHACAVGPLLISFLNLSPTIATAATADRARIMSTAMKKARLSPGEVGGGIWDLQDDRILLEHRAGDLMIPASLSKIVTALTVLDRFPSSTQFETQILVSEPIIDGTLKGDLVIRGGGDPAFVSEALADLVQKIKAAGLRKVEGNLVVDDQRFDQERFDSHRESKRVDRAYDAPIGALSFDWNAVSIYARPGLKSGEPAVVHVEPLSPYLRVINRATTSGDGNTPAISVSRSAAKGVTGDAKNSSVVDEVDVGGHIPLQAVERAYYKSISQPDLWTAENLIQFLARENITISGSIRRQASLTDKKYETLVANRSPLIGELVLSMMKFSNNFIAEMLTKNLAVLNLADSKGASMDKGIGEIQNWLKARNLKGKPWTFVNPSGLTNENRLTPSQLGELLKYAYGNLKIYPEFTSSLPIAGLDGTLKHRARNSAGQIRAKTGLLKDAGVAALAGFATTANGHTRAFAWIVNRPHQIQNLRNVWDFLDAMATSAALE